MPPRAKHHVPTARLLRRLALTAVLCGIGTAIYVLITTVVIIRTAYSPLPLFDGWDTWRLYLSYKSYTTFLFTAHNEHRIAIPRLFFMIDHYWFFARGAFVLISSFVIQAVLALGLWRLVTRAGAWTRSSFVLLGCVIITSLFSAQQFTNFTWAFQIGFACVHCAAIGAMFAMLRAAEKWELDGRPEWWLSVACIAGAIATYSLASGLLIWPVLLLLSIWLRLPRRFSVVIGMDGLMMFGLYLYGYKAPPGHVQPLDSIVHHFFSTVTFGMAFIGSPTEALLFVLPVNLHAEGMRVSFAIIAGVFGAITALVSYVMLWLRREWVTWSQGALLHIPIFILFTAAAVALGRGGTPISEAMTSRYRTPALIFWVSLAAFYWPLLELPSRWRQIAFVAGTLCLAVVSVPQQQRWMTYARTYADAIGEAQSAMVADVFDAPVWTRAYHSPSTLMQVVPYLRENHLSVFREEWTHWVGKPMAGQFVRDNESSCIGAVDTTVVISERSPGWKVTGWAWDRKAKAGPGTIVFLDDVGTIIGVARSVSARSDVVLLVPEVKSARVGWLGYIAGKRHTRATAYILESDGKSLCAVGMMKL